MSEIETPWRRWLFVFALLFAALFSAGGCTRPDVHDDFTDTEALAAMEAFVAESVAELDDFPGFAARSVVLDECRHGVDRNEVLDGHDTVSLTYEFPEASWDDPLVRETYPAVLADFWESQGHKVTTRTDDSGAVTGAEAVRDDGIGLYLTIRGKVVIDVSVGGGAQCVVVDDEPFTIPEALGGVPPEHDRFTDHGPRDSA